ncbi:MAG: acyl-CoA thioesterase [Fluviicola sp.]|nr:acyl-CoA thioesterase [Fluviicola sp.]
MKIPPAPIQIRFADIDIMGHVNNAIYLSYFENTRMHYFKYMLGRDWDWNKDGIILLKNEVEYIRPVRMTDSPEVTMKVDKIGNKSFTLSYELAVKGVIYCKGLSILVGYDNENHKSIAIPTLMRTELEKLKSEQ